MKPVYPISFGDINLINRFIIPYIYAEGQDENDLKGLISEDSGFDLDFGSALNGSTGSADGFGDITYQGFFTSADPGPILWGLGPAVTLPTHGEDRFGSDKVSAGPSLVVLAKPGKWLFGTLIQHQWDVAGRSSAADVEKSSMQVFVNYNFTDGWYFTSSPTVTANWEADSDARWKVPVGGGIGKLHRFGKLPVDFKLVGYSNVEQSDFGPDYEITFTVKFIFPK
ncbi:MAG: neuromedin U [Coraliomargarita sp.]|nr:neuromedin U [Coraliomargarita sp.]